METQFHLPYGRLRQLSFTGSVLQGRETSGCNPQPPMSLEDHFFPASPICSVSQKSASRVRPRSETIARVQAASLTCLATAPKRKVGGRYDSKEQTAGSLQQGLEDHEFRGAQLNHLDFENDSRPSCSQNDAGVDTGPESDRNVVGTVAGVDIVNTLPTKQLDSNRSVDRQLRILPACSDKPSAGDDPMESHTGVPPERCSVEELTSSDFPEPSLAQMPQVSVNPTYIATAPPVLTPPSQPPSNRSSNQHASTSGDTQKMTNSASRGVPYGSQSQEVIAQRSKLAVPKHLAVIMDGNSRWAKAKGLPTAFGHEQGVESLLNLVKMCARWGVVALTVYAFSTENWLRPKVSSNSHLGTYLSIRSSGCIAYLSRKCHDCHTV